MDTRLWICPCVYVTFFFPQCLSTSYSASLDEREEYHLSDFSPETEVQIWDPLGGFLFWKTLYNHRANGTESRLENDGSIFNVYPSYHLCGRRNSKDMPSATPAPPRFLSHGYLIIH